jgi:hypothetical protein
MKSVASDTAHRRARRPPGAGMTGQPVAVHLHGELEVQRHRLGHRLLPRNPLCCNGDVAQFDCLAIAGCRAGESPRAARPAPARRPPQTVATVISGLSMVGRTNGRRPSRRTGPEGTGDGGDVVRIALDRAGRTRHDHVARFGRVERSGGVHTKPRVALTTRRGPSADTSSTVRSPSTTSLPAASTSKRPDECVQIEPSSGSAEVPVEYLRTGHEDGLVMAGDVVQGFVKVFQPVGDRHDVWVHDERHHPR